MLYYCNPKKNTKCKKTHCFINGGMCFCTTEKTFKRNRLNEMFFKFVHRNRKNYAIEPFIQNQNRTEG
jgi:hypothetical protein